MIVRTLRRIYILVAAFVGLRMVAGGLVEICTLLGERWLGSAPLGAAQMEAVRLGSSVALVLIGLPLWGGHWALAQRDAREPEGQHAPLRRLYAYAVLLTAAFAVLFGLANGLGVALEGRGAILMIAPLASVAVNAAIWAAHWRIFAADRDVVEREGANATLRRWYLALTRWVSLGMLGFGAGVLIHAMLQRFIFGVPGSPRQLAMPAAALVSGLLIWLPHEVWSRRLVRAAGPLRADELASTLRQVYTALVIVVSLVASLTGLTALLAAGVRAALGVMPVADAFVTETRGAAALVVALPILLYHREQLALTARLSGAEARLTTARRLINYLVNAVSLVTLYVGLGGLAGTLMRLWLGEGVLGLAWPTPLSWYAATALVATPVYVLASRVSEARARGSAEEARAVSRRVYLYAALLFGVIATVVTATQLIQLLVVALLGQGGRGAAGEIGRLAGYTALGGVIIAGYTALLRRASAARGTAGAGLSVVLVTDESMLPALEVALAHELPGARIAAFAGGDTPERRAALAAADLLILPLAALGDAALGAFTGARVLLATPVEGYTLVGARHTGLAREAARKALALGVTARPTAPPEAPPTLAPTPA